MFYHKNLILTVLAILTTSIINELPADPSFLTCDRIRSFEHNATSLINNHITLLDPEYIQAFANMFYLNYASCLLESASRKHARSMLYSCWKLYKNANTSTNSEEIAVDENIIHNLSTLLKAKQFINNAWHTSITYLEQSDDQKVLCTLDTFRNKTQIIFFSYMDFCKTSSSLTLKKYAQFLTDIPFSLLNSLFKKQVNKHNQKIDAEESLYIFDDIAQTSLALQNHAWTIIEHDAEIRKTYEDLLDMYRIICLAHYKMLYHWMKHEDYLAQNYMFLMFDNKGIISPEAHKELLHNPIKLGYSFESYQLTVLNIV